MNSDLNYSDRPMWEVRVAQRLGSSFNKLEINVKSGIADFCMRHAGLFSDLSKLSVYTPYLLLGASIGYAIGKENYATASLWSGALASWSILDFIGLRRDRKINEFRNEASKAEWN